MQDDAFLDVDRNGVLRIPGVLWFGLALLIRHWILALSVAVSARRTGSVVLLMGDGVPWLALAFEIPAVVLLFAAFNRTPAAGAMPRFIWHRGRWIISAAAAMNILWAAEQLAKSSYWQPWPELFLASCALIDLAIAASVWTRPFYKQLFLEFPAKPTQAGKDPS